MYEKINVTIKNYLQLWGLFFKIGAMTFGGGLAMLPILERELSEKRDWATKDQLLDYYAIGQSTPGIIAVNVATFIGFNRGGILGGIFATLGIVTPSIIIITFLASFISSYSDISWVKKILAGINVAVAAILTKAAWDFGKKTIKNILGLLIFIASFVAVYFLKIDTVIIIGVSAIIGVIFHLISSKKALKNKAGEEDT
ncbi:MAG: chromate transporter [Spirochaetaceae bacterium]|nr:chromate transporter [Spirochaetaceae bacterium]